MNDYELLELAAKAAGIKKHPILSGRFSRPGKMERIYDMGSAIEVPFVWDPYEDYGDALWLAVKLDLSVCLTLGGMNFPWGTAMVGYSPWSNPKPIATCRFDNQDGKMEAVCRAIVLAAAEIGKAMP